MGLKLNHILNFGLGLGFELEPWLLASASLFDGLALRAAGLDPCFVKKCWCISHKVSVCCWPSFTTARNVSCAWSKSVWSFFHRFATIEFPIWLCRAMFQYKQVQKFVCSCPYVPLSALASPCLPLPPLVHPFDVADWSSEDGKFGLNIHFLSRTWIEKFVCSPLVQKFRIVLTVSQLCHSKKPSQKSHQC